MKPYKIIYIFDALCTWCYGFSPVIKGLYDIFGSKFEFEVLSGGMILNERAGSHADPSQAINASYPNVESTTGITFGKAFLDHLEKGMINYSSEKPSIALSVFKTFQPEKAVLFAHDLQQSIYFDGKDPNSTELYRYLAVNFGIDPDEFESMLLQENYKDAAYYDFALVKQLQVESYPAVLVQENESKFFLIAKGFTDFETLELRLNNVIKEIQVKAKD
ncbi:DsbA family protein [Daejeonella oryzae]|uniref:DsbA family protein n=1 Tax=Daejeonella oryzae TaxID=1122943 RepID=UPI0004117A67|nr:DsbA family protein [Daejeonella oryzae]